MAWNDEPAPEASPSKMPWLLLILAVAAAGLLFISLWRPTFADNSPTGPRHPAVLAKTNIRGLAFQPIIDAVEPLDSKDLAGKVTLINFWGPWCPPCGVEFPHLMELRSEFVKEKDFAFVSVSCLSRPGEEKTITDDTQAFLKGRGAKLPVYVDEQMASRRKLMADTKLSPDDFGYPATIVLDRQGNLRGFWIGYRSGWEVEMAEVVRKTLQDKAPK